MYQARGRAYVTLGQFTLATHWTRGFIFATLLAPDDVTSTDYAAALLERGRAKAAGRGSGAITAAAFLSATPPPHLLSLLDGYKVFVSAIINRFWISRSQLRFYFLPTNSPYPSR